MELGKLIDALIPIIAGGYLYLYYLEVIPHDEENREKFENWKERWGTVVKICGPGAVIFGFIKLFGGI